MQTEADQLTQADEATAALINGDAAERRQAIKVLKMLAGMGATEAVRSTAAAVLHQMTQAGKPH